MSKGAHTTLKVLSILNIIGGILSVILALGAIVTGGLLPGILQEAASGEVAQLDSALAPTGVTSGSLGAMFVGGGIGLMIASVLQIVMGALGVRASNNAQKVGPVWVFALIVLVLQVIGFVSTVVMGAGSGTNLISSIVSIVLAALLFWSANSVKNETRL